MRKLILIVVVLIVILGAWNAFVLYSPYLKSIISEKGINFPAEKVKITTEDSVVIDIVEKVTPSVVTVGIEQRIVNFDPFNFFQNPQGRREDQDIGSGFIVASDGLIVTNKHVVSVPGKYNVITNDGKKYEVQSIYRDPVNDIAIIKINPSAGLGQVFKPVEMGDSSTIKVGQLAVAVGTPLGEFRGSVTKGIISGIGRGIVAGSALEGFAEKLDDVIQTDAAINPGNSGGPLVNSSAQVIGINTAVASGAENIGFALPINIVKDSLRNFNQNGQFNRPYLGVVYRILSKNIAILNDVPQGAFVQSVVEDSPAEKAGVLQGDIILSINGKKIGENDSTIAQEIANKKIGDVITLSVWRDGETLEIKATLASSPNQ